MVHLCAVILAASVLSAPAGADRGLPRASEDLTHQAAASGGHPHGSAPQEMGGSVGVSGGVDRLSRATKNNDSEAQVHDVTASLLSPGGTDGLAQAKPYSDSEHMPQKVTVDVGVPKGSAGNVSQTVPQDTAVNVADLDASASATGRIDSPAQQGPADNLAPPGSAGDLDQAAGGNASEAVPHAVRVLSDSVDSSSPVAVDRSSGSTPDTTAADLDVPNREGGPSRSVTGEDSEQVLQKLPEIMPASGSTDGFPQVETGSSSDAYELVPRRSATGSVFSSDAGGFPQAVEGNGSESVPYIVRVFPDSADASPRAAEGNTSESVSRQTAANINLSGDASGVPDIEASNAPKPARQQAVADLVTSSGARDLSQIVAKSSPESTQEAASGLVISDDAGALDQAVTDNNSESLTQNGEQKENQEKDSASAEPQTGRSKNKDGEEVEKANDSSEGAESSGQTQTTESSHSMDTSSSRISSNKRLSPRKTQATESSGPAGTSDIRVSTSQRLVQGARTGVNISGTPILPSAPFAVLQNTRAGALVAATEASSGSMESVIAENRQALSDYLKTSQALMAAADAARRSLAEGG